MTQEATIAEKDEFRKAVNRISFRKQEYAMKSADIYEDSFMVDFQSSKRVEAQEVIFDNLSPSNILPEIAFTFQVARRCSVYPIFSLSKHTLKESFNLIVEQNEEGKILIWNEKFGVCGIGDSKEEALNEFEDLIFSDYQSLKKIPQGSLSEGAIELLNNYKFHLG